MPASIRFLLGCALAGACAAVFGGCSESPVSAGAPATTQGRTPGPGTPTALEVRRTKKRPSICSLVTAAEAESIVRLVVLRPKVAPLGPTCLYRSARSGRTLATLAVQTTSLQPMLRLMRHTTRVRVAGRTAYCGTVGKPMLLLSLPRGRVLTIATPCPLARRFAATALPRLRAYY